MACAVSGLRVVERAAPDLADQRLGGGDRLGRRREELADVRVDRGVELAGRHDGVHEADLPRARGGEARAGEKQLARGRAADLRQRRTARSPPAGCRASPR